MRCRPPFTDPNLKNAWGIAFNPNGFLRLGERRRDRHFGRFSNTLLVGNFGDGRISAFDTRSGDLLGQLREPGGHRVEIAGLWGIAFGNGIQHQPTHALFFAAGRRTR